MEDYGKDTKSIYKLIKYRNYYSTAAVTVATSSTIYSTISSAAFTKEYHSAVKYAASMTFITVRNNPSNKKVPASKNMHPTPTVTTATVIKLYPTSIAATDVPVVWLELVNLEFELCLSLPVLAMENLSILYGPIVDLVSLYRQSQRILRNTEYAVNKKTS